MDAWHRRRIEICTLSASAIVTKVFEMPVITLSPWTSSWLPVTMSARESPSPIS